MHKLAELCVRRPVFASVLILIMLLLGIGITTRQAKWRTVIPVLAAWVITLPVSALVAALLFKTIPS